LWRHIGCKLRWQPKQNLESLSLQFKRANGINIGHRTTVEAEERTETILEETRIRKIKVNRVRVKATEDIAMFADSLIISHGLVPTDTAFDIMQSVAAVLN
jgi:hypothetical protein